MKFTALAPLVLSFLSASACVDLTKPAEVSACGVGDAGPCINRPRADTNPPSKKDGSSGGEDSPVSAPDTATAPTDTTPNIPPDTGTKDTGSNTPDLPVDQAIVKIDTAPPVEPPAIEPRPEPTVEPPIVVVEPRVEDAAPPVDTRPAPDTQVRQDTLPIDTLTSDVAAGNCMEAVKANGYAFPPANPCSACKENSISRETVCTALIDCLAANHPCTNNCWTDCRNKAGASSVAEACATSLKNAACGAP